ATTEASCRRSCVSPRTSRAPSAAPSCAGSGSEHAARQHRRPAKPATPMTATHAQVLVVGGGLAGLAAAIELADRGLSVHLIEANEYVGGRAASWLDEGMTVESGLHRYLGFYRALPAFLRRCGLDPNDVLCWEDELEVRLPDGEAPAVFSTAPVHRPLRTPRSLLANNHLVGPRDK